MSWRWKLYSNAARIPAILRTETRNGMMLELFCYRLLITTSRHSSRDKTPLYPTLRRVRGRGQTGEIREEGIRLAKKQPHGSQKLEGARCGPARFRRADD